MIKLFKKLYHNILVFLNIRPEVVKRNALQEKYRRYFTDDDILVARNKVAFRKDSVDLIISLLEETVLEHRFYGEEVQEEIESKLEEGYPLRTKCSDFFMSREHDEVLFTLTVYQDDCKDSKSIQFRIWYLSDSNEWRWNSDPYNHRFNVAENKPTHQEARESLWQAERWPSPCQSRTTKH